MDYLRQDLEKEAKAERQRRVELREQWEGACYTLSLAQELSSVENAEIKATVLLEAIAKFLKIQTDIATGGI